MKPIARNGDSAIQVAYHKPIRSSSKLRRFAVGAFGALCALCWGGVRGAEAANLPVVTPVTTCADLLQLDFTGLEDAPTKLDSAVVVEASASNPTQQCVVTGYVASTGFCSDGGLVVRRVKEIDQRRCIFDRPHTVRYRR
jgi:hypothetical protein